MSVDKSVSKTGECVLKATALFGIFALISDSANTHYECSENFNAVGFAGAYAVGFALLLLGEKIIEERLKELHPWVFVGRNWPGIVIYSALTVSVLFLSGPILEVVNTSPITIDSSAVCK